MSGFDFLLKRLFTVEEPNQEKEPEQKKKFNVFDLFLDEESKHDAEEEGEGEWADIDDEKNLF